MNLGLPAAQPSPAAPSVAVPVAPPRVHSRWLRALQGPDWDDARQCLDDVEADPSEVDHALAMRQALAEARLRARLDDEARLAWLWGSGRRDAAADLARTLVQAWPDSVTAEQVLDSLVRRPPDPPAAGRPHPTGLPARAASAGPASEQESVVRPGSAQGAAAAGPASTAARGSQGGPAGPVSSATGRPTLRPDVPAAPATPQASTRLAMLLAMRRAGRPLSLDDLAEAVGEIRGEGGSGPDDEGHAWAPAVRRLLEEGSEFWRCGPSTWSHESLLPVPMDRLAEAVHFCVTRLEQRSTLRSEKHLLEEVEGAGLSDPAMTAELLGSALTRHPEVVRPAPHRYAHRTARVSAEALPQGRGGRRGPRRRRA